MTVRIPKNQNSLNAPFSLEDWREFYTERAGVAEHDGSMTRKKAERMAYESCIVRWLDTHLPRITPDACTHCGKPSGIVGRASVITGSGHYFHHDCHTPWMTQRRQGAIMALAGMGIISKE